MENIVLAAFGAGVLSFFSPCVFPLAAGLLSIISGISLKEIAQGKKAQCRVKNRMEERQPGVASRGSPKPLWFL